MAFQAVNMAHPQRAIAASTAKPNFFIGTKTSEENDEFVLKL